jgi:hypothetical protein
VRTNDDVSDLRFHAGEKPRAALKKSRSGPCETERPDRFNDPVYFWASQQVFAGAVLFTPKQHSLAGLQQAELAAQQSLALAVVAPKQHSLGGSQHSDPVEQQSLAFAFVAVKQHSLAGLQQAESVEQQSNFWYAASPATHRAPVITTAVNIFMNMRISFENGCVR